LTPTQVTALSTTQTAAMNTAQTLALPNATVQSMSTSQIAALSTTRIAALVLDTTGIAGLSTAQILALTTTQVPALTTAQMAALTTSQIPTLTTRQVVALTTSQIQALTTIQIPALETTDIAAWSHNTLGIGALTTTQTDALTTTQIRALSTSQIQALALSNTSFPSIQVLSTAALSFTLSFGSFSDTATLQVLTTTDIPQLTTADIASLTQITPLVLDLDGNGISTVNMSSGVRFDLAASGEKLQTGWIAGGDGLLVMDRNQDGVIEDGAELFGSATRLPDGTAAPDGYAALRTLDANHDGSITGDDPGFAALEVWVDRNSDGVSQSGELKSLESLGIVQLDLNASVSSAIDHGNLLGLVSGYETADGVKHDMADVWFATQTVAGGNLAATPPVTAVDLSRKVSGLTQAIADYRDNPDADGVVARLDSVPGDCAVTQPLAVATNQGAIVDRLRQFNADGSPWESASGSLDTLQSVSAGSRLSLPDSQGPNKNGILSSGGK
jgi:hypothetical protein